MNEKAFKLGNMRIPKLLITLSLPAMISMLVQATYNIVDSIFVAQVSEEALAAINIAFPLQMIIISIMVGLGIGITSFISRSLGAKKPEEAANAALHGYLIGAVLWIGLIVVALTVPRIFFERATDNQEVIDQGVKYITIIIFMSIGRIFAKVSASILVGNGDMISSVKIQLLGAISNIILDPLLIFGVLFIPGMGIVGAAVATSAAQVISMIYGLYLIFIVNRKALGLKVRLFRINGRIIGLLLIVGLPAMIMQGLSSVMIIYINLILTEFSNTAINVMGVYFKLQSLIFMPIFGLCQGLMPIIGYNFGARNKDRIMEAITFATKVSLAIMLVGLIVFQLIPRQLLWLFNASELMYSLGISAFRTLSLGFLFASFSIIMSTVFIGLGKAYLSLVSSLLRQVVILLPLASYLSNRIGLDGVWRAFPITEVITFGITVLLAVLIHRMVIRKLDPVLA